VSGGVGSLFEGLGVRKFWVAGRTLLSGDQKHRKTEFPDIQNYDPTGKSQKKQVAFGIPYPVVCGYTPLSNNITTYCRETTLKIL